MTLKEANEELERLDNEYNYWLNEKERLSLLVSPKSMDIRPEMVEGGKRVDKLALYVESMDDKKINETLEYIQKKKQNLMNWLDNELSILKKYNEIEQLIVYYKENVMITDKYTNKRRNMTWEEISKEVHYSKDYCRKIYRNYKYKKDHL
jgi:hypothetical protein